MWTEFVDLYLGDREVQDFPGRAGDVFGDRNGTGGVEVDAPTIPPAPRPSAAPTVRPTTRPTTAPPVTAPPTTAPPVTAPPSTAPATP
jgi:hypothetical protein